MHFYIKQIQIFLQHNCLSTNMEQTNTLCRISQLTQLVETALHKNSLKSLENLKNKYLFA